MPVLVRSPTFSPRPEGSAPAFARLSFNSPQLVRWAHTDNVVGGVARAQGPATSPGPTRIDIPTRPGIPFMIWDGERSSSKTRSATGSSTSTRMNSEPSPGTSTFSKNKEAISVSRTSASCRASCALRFHLRGEQRRSHWPGDHLAHDVSEDAEPGGARNSPC